MAEKKYVDLTGLTTYDGKIKALIDEKDAATLAAAKAHAEGLGSNYDQAGTAATKVQELADGQVKANKEAIAKLNGDATTDGSVAKAVSDAKTALEGKITAVEGKADAAQGDVDNLETYVGTIPETAKSKNVVAYVDEKTSGIASDAELNALKTRMTTAEGSIKTNADDIDALEGRADAVEAKATANAAAITTLNGEGAGSVKKQIDDAFNDFATKVSDDNVVNTYKELVDYCATHSSEAAEMAGNIAKNATAISALEKFVGKLPEGTSAADVIGYINEKVAAEQSRAEKAEGALDTRVKAIEAKFGEGEGSVADQIADAVKVETDARTAADAALDTKITAAKKAGDDAQADVDALEGVVATKAAAADVTALGTRVTAAEKDIDDLQAAIGTDGSVTAAIADAKKAGTDAQSTANQNKTDIATLNTTVAGHTSTLSAQGDKITALEGKVGDGFTPITNEEIEKLFAAQA